MFPHSAFHSKHISVPPTRVLALRNTSHGHSTIPPCARSAQKSAAEEYRTDGREHLFAKKRRTMAKNPGIGEFTARRDIHLMPAWCAYAVFRSKEGGEFRKYLYLPLSLCPSERSLVLFPTSTKKSDLGEEVSASLRRTAQKRLNTGDGVPKR